MIYSPYPFRCCTKCGSEFLPTLENFTHMNQRNDKLHPWCKVCTRTASAANLIKHPYVPKPPRLKTGYRTCTKCGQTHPENTEHFYRIKAKNDFSSRCKLCIRTKYRDYGNEHQDARAKRAKQWKQQYRDRARQNEQRREARKRSLPYAFTSEDWRRALDYFGNCCAICGRPRGLWHILAQDHWIPLNKGGPYTADNIVPLCHGIDGCNNTKRDETPQEWVIAQYGPKKAKIILARIEQYFEWVKQQDDH